jgi:hypothetical protein
MEKASMTDEFGKQVFDNLGINPYEVVISVSKMARDVNDKSRKYLNPCEEINPVQVALHRLSRGVEFTYEGENVSKEPSSAEE